MSNNIVCQPTIPNPNYNSGEYAAWNGLNSLGLESGVNPYGPTIPNPVYNAYNCSTLEQQQYNQQNAPAIAKKASLTPSSTTNAYLDNNLSGSFSAIQWLDNLPNQIIDGQKISQFELNKIQNLRCPPPVDPTVANSQLQLLNQAMQEQNNQLSDIVSQIALIKSIYKIQFQINSVNVYNENATNVKSQMIITGELPNPQLSFIIQPANTGIPGRNGGAGPPGNSGGPGLPGMQGIQGYWGIQASAYTN